MISLKLILVLLVVIYQVSCSSFEDDWLVHKAKYNLSFKSNDEELQKINNFIENKRLIESHNTAESSLSKSFTLKENSRIHYSPSEFKEKLLLKLNVSKKLKTDHHMAKSLRKKLIKNNQQLNDSTNWIEKGVVGPVQDQLDCGSCYAFTTSNAISSAYSIKTNKSIDLSKQQIVDCTMDNYYGNYGCSGGFMESSFGYAMQVGLVKDSLYSYTGKVSSCKAKQLIDSEHQEVYKIAGFSQTNYFAVDEMKSTVRMRGPAVAYMAASSRNFLMYGSGVYNDETCVGKYDIDHVVMIVGYGTDEETGKKYWMVKNTWGTGWGENGYAKVARDMNICGIETVFFYPTL